MNQYLTPRQAKHLARVVSQEMYLETSIDCQVVLAVLDPYRRSWIRGALERKYGHQLSDRIVREIANRTRVAAQ